jgi:hypothetical protein
MKRAQSVFFTFILTVPMMFVYGSEVSTASVDCVEPVAHRGVHYNLDENSLPAISAAEAVGPVELDVAITKDKRFVLMHDSTVNRMTDGKGFVRDLTLAEIKELRTNRGYEVPTVSEAIRRAEKFNVSMFLELKRFQEWSPSLFESIANQASKADVEIWLGGIGSGFESTLKNYYSNIYWRPNYSTTPSVASAKALSATAVFMTMPRWLETPELVDILENEGIETGARLSVKFRVADSLGLDYILTDEPYKVWRFCRSF